MELCFQEFIRPLVACDERIDHPLRLKVYPILVSLVEVEGYVQRVGLETNCEVVNHFGSIQTGGIEVLD